MRQSGAWVSVGGAGWQADNTISIGGVWYQASGVFPSLPAYTLTAAAPVYYAQLSIPAPFTRPAGYGFVPYITRTSRFAMVAAGNSNSETVLVNYVQFVTPAIDTSLRIGWRLVPIA